MPPDSERPQISVIVTNFNGCHLLRDCLRSIFEKTSGLTYEVIVVDDASSDNSAQVIREEFPTVRLIVNQSNLGFCRANNVGAGVARGQYLLLFNNDTIIQNNAVGILVNFMTQHEDIGICGGILLRPDGNPDISYGNFPSLLEAIQGAFFLDKFFPKATCVKQRAKMPPKDLREPIEVDYVSGANLCIRKEIVVELGLFDERFEAYCEEVDLCLRVKKTGKWRVLLVPEAKILHLFGASYGVGERKIRLLHSSYSKFLFKYHSAPYAYAVRTLYAARYAALWLSGKLRLLVARREAHTIREKTSQAAYGIRYTLFPNK